MREDNLLCLRRRKFIVTTDSRHGFPIYPNLAGKLQLTDVNQLWIADITYIRLEIEFVYLAHGSGARDGLITSKYESGSSFVSRVSMDL
jgi:hypothetical protein